MPPLSLNLKDSLIPLSGGFDDQVTSSVRSTSPNGFEDLLSRVSFHYGPGCLRVSGAVAPSASFDQMGHFENGACDRSISPVAVYLSKLPFFVRAENPPYPKG